ncbi:MAG: methyltransferase domain-containing protein [Acidobacteria bacterium]|nr:methyltransferase domain-containing protein [Acidobacteriota bacterium]
MSLIVDEHRQYLADEVRVSAYQEAIAEVVGPGDVVLDLASGTGILGLLACRAGAKRVYSIEQGGMIELARTVARANGFEDRITYVKGHSTRVELPEPVDVAICDQAGHFGFEAGILELFNDVRERFLKPGGRLIPQRISIHLAPVECPEIWGQVAFWSESVAGFDFGPARAWAANTGYPTRFSSGQILAEPGLLCSLDLPQGTPPSLSGEVRFRATRAGTLHGIGGWFSAQLSENVSMTNSPLAARSIGRRNVFFPLERPVPLTAEDGVRVQMHIIPAELLVSWKVEVREGDERHIGAGKNGLKARFAHSTLRGMLLAREDLRKTRPEFVPRLSPWGQARRSVLELCDGHTPLAEIEREVYRRHPSLFPSLGEAAAFVAEVVLGYAL